VSQERRQQDGAFGWHATPDYPGGAPAPASGSYEQHNVFGRATGHRIAVTQGQPLPALPRGFAWRLVGPTDGAGS